MFNVALKGWYLKKNYKKNCFDAPKLFLRPIMIQINCTRKVINEIMHNRHTKINKFSASSTDHLVCRLTQSADYFFHLLFIWQVNTFFSCHMKLILVTFTIFVVATVSGIKKLWMQWFWFKRNKTFALRNTIDKSHFRMACSLRWSITSCHKWMREVYH